MPQVMRLMQCAERRDTHQAESSRDSQQQPGLAVLELDVCCRGDTCMTGGVIIAKEWLMLLCELWCGFWLESQTLNHGE